MLLGRISPRRQSRCWNAYRHGSQARPETRILEAALEHSLRRLRQENPDSFFLLVEAWLKEEDLYPRQAGLRA